MCHLYFVCIKNTHFVNKTNRAKSNDVLFFFITCLLYLMDIIRRLLYSFIVYSNHMGIIFLRELKEYNNTIWHASSVLFNIDNMHCCF